MHAHTQVSMSLHLTLSVTDKKLLVIIYRIYKHTHHLPGQAKRHDLLKVLFTTIHVCMYVCMLI